MNESAPLLDLDYTDPPPPPGLAARARQQGRRNQRRRSAGLVAGAGLVAAAVAVTVQLAGGPAGIQVADPSAGATWPATGGGSGLPFSSGQGPVLKHPSTWTPEASLPKGDPIVLDTSATGAQRLAWVSQGNWACYGTRASAAAPPKVSACDPVSYVPGQGLFLTAQWGDGDGPPDSGEVQSTVVSGFVRGDVSRVMIGLPSGPVDAQLTPAPDPRLGTFYWVVTTDYTTDGLVAATGQPAYTPDRVVFDGNRPVFGCHAAGCVAQPGTTARAS